MGLKQSTGHAPASLDVHDDMTASRPGAGEHHSNVYTLLTAPHHWYASAMRVGAALPGHPRTMRQLYHMAGSSDPAANSRLREHLGLELADPRAAVGHVFEFLERGEQRQALRLALVRAPMACGRPRHPLRYHRLLSRVRRLRSDELVVAALHPPPQPLSHRRRRPQRCCAAANTSDRVRAQH